MITRPQGTSTQLPDRESRLAVRLTWDIDGVVDVVNKLDEAAVAGGPGSVVGQVSG